MMKLVALPRIKPMIMKLRFAVGKWLGAAGAGLLVSACAATPPDPSTVPALLDQPAYQVEEVDFLGMTDAMGSFVNELAPVTLSPQKRAWTFSYSVLDPWLLPFDYDANQTLPAAETFLRKTGNCLSFSAMVVAMARSVGLQAWFQEVKVPPQWTNIGETYLVSMHVNAVVKGRNANFIVDVSGTRRSDWLETRKIPDSEAVAQYYNNLGADALVQQDLPKAYAYFLQAMHIAPNASYIWSNLAVVLNRNGQVGDAISTYRKALEIHPGELTALNNLEQLYYEAGDLANAREMRYRVDRYRNKNPWYKYQRSLEAMSENRLDDAIELLQDAIGINPGEYRFHYALARAWQLAGDSAESSASLERAQRMAPPGAEVSQSGLGQILLNVDG
jgi:tetratricopeptide (TPR) repeat protein